MNEVVKISQPAGLTYTDEQEKLIRDTVARGATHDEFKLFMYRAKNMGLDPLKPGQIHFIKYGNSPGSIVVGIDGMRSRAERTGKRAGVKRGVILNVEGQVTGAWAEVYRKDWNEPAREEVRLSEYSTGKAGWAKMPETMIKKVAEAAALRMAFPDELGGIYAEEEMGVGDKAKPEALAEILELTKSLNRDEKALTDYLARLHKRNVEHLEDLTAEEAQRTITTLSQMLKERTKSPEADENAG